MPNKKSSFDPDDAPIPMESSAPSPPPPAPQPKPELQASPQTKDFGGGNPGSTEHMPAPAASASDAAIAIDSNSATVLHPDEAAGQQGLVERFQSEGYTDVALEVSSRAGDGKPNGWRGRGTRNGAPFQLQVDSRGNAIAI